MNTEVQTKHETANREQVLTALAYLMTRYMQHHDASTAASIIHHLELMRSFESDRDRVACGYRLYDYLLKGWHHIRMKKNGSPKASNLKNTLH